MDGEWSVCPASRIDTTSVPLVEVSTASDFAACLDQLRVLAGPLSNRQIADRSGGALRRTKIGQVLAGELPRREFLVTYLDVCGIPAEETEAWLRVWTRLVSSTTGLRRGSEDEVARLRTERDTSRRQAHALTEEVELLRSNLREAQAAQAAAVRTAWQAKERRDSAEGQLRAAEVGRREAIGQTRSLSGELTAAVSRVTELTDTVSKLREELAGERNRLRAALEEVDQLRDQLTTRHDADGNKRLVRYSSREAAELYGSDALTAPPFLGQ